MGEVINFNDIKKKEKTKDHSLEEVLNRSSFDDIESIIEYYVNKSINTENIDDDIFYILNYDLIGLRYLEITDIDTNNKIVSLYNKIHTDHKDKEDELLYASVLTNTLINYDEEMLSENGNKILEEVNKKIGSKNLN